MSFSPSSFSDPELCRGLLAELRRELDGPLRFMEVCGTHTVAIFRSGLRSLLPKEITHLSGPGCPVCVTHDREVAAFLEVAGKSNVTLATFGDLMRVPGPGGANLKEAKALGADVEVVYSPLDALALAKARPEREVVFPAVGFETTAPATAATVMKAKAEGIRNFSLLCFHKLVPPALEALLADTEEPGIDAFLLPGHVSTILGLEPYRFVADRFGKPCVVGGFDPADILQSLLLMVRMRREGRADVLNQYSRAVADAGNPKARDILFTVFEQADALWRGLGAIPESGLRMRECWRDFDAFAKLGLGLPDVPEIKGCKCGDILKGRKTPDTCPLFGRACTPAKPVGPCMVSTEGSCAAYYKYQGEAV